ncbi:MAG: glutathione transferase GstA [Thiobacillus sp.]|nr:glutathione transferase GstA [Thiobacillus sp.]
MRLYYAPGACSLAPHIVLREVGANFTLTRVNTATHRVEDGADYYTIAPKGQVPVLELDDGTRISEGPVVCQFIADQAGDTALLPAYGSLARLRVLEWCNYLTSEIHKSFTPIFHRHVDTAAIDALKTILQRKLAWVDTQLQGRAHLTGEPFTIADAYLYVLATWAPPVELDLSGLEHLHAFQRRVAERPAVRAARRAEGLPA